MHSNWYLFVIFFIVIFLLYLTRKRRKKYIAKRLNKRNRVINNREKGRIIMKELVERFVGKDVYVKLLEGTADGVIREVTDRGIVLENKGGMQIVNLDYIVKVREYPYKNGKRATIWGE